MTPAECYVNPDDLGDTDEVICVFSYAGEEPHALVSVVDYNADGMIKDGWVTSRVSKLLDHCREIEQPARGQRPVRGRSRSRHAFREVDAGQARHMLETALTVTDSVADPSVSESFPSYHAFIRARIRALPPSAAARCRPPGSGGTPGAGTAGPCSPPSSSPPTRPRTCPTAVRPATAPTGSSTTGATRTSGGRCG